jgi:ketosteroid isomerase-like protein
MSEAAVEAELTALLRSWAAALVANDPDRIAGFLEPDWSLVTPESGAVPGDRFLGLVASGALSHSRMSFDVLEVRVLEPVALVTAHGTNTGMWQGQPFEADEWVTDVFVRRHDGWRCCLSVLTPNLQSPLHARRD